MSRCTILIVPILLLSLFFIDAASGDAFFELDPAQFIVWGDALNGDIVLPTRDIIVQMVNKKGENVTEPVDLALDVRLIPDPGVMIRARVQWWRLGGGQIAIMIRSYTTFEHLMVEITWDDVPVRGSPFEIVGFTSFEECDCPTKTLDELLDAMQCPPSYPAIEKGLDAFSAINTTEAVDIAVDRLGDKSMGHGFAVYIIKDNQLHRRSFGYAVANHRFWDGMFLSLMRKAVLPDMVLIANYRDNELLANKTEDIRVPVLSTYADNRFYDIPFPNYEVLLSVSEAIKTETKHVYHTVARAAEENWDKRKSQIMWRGQDINEAAVALVRHSIERPELINARFVVLRTYSNDSSLGQLDKGIPFYDHFAYKYITGPADVSFMNHVFMSGRMVCFKRDVTAYEHYSSVLTPMKHYIPVADDYSDLVAKVEWARAHDAEAEQIAVNAQRAVYEATNARATYCYVGRLLQQLARRQTNEITLPFGYVHKRQPEWECDCLAKVRSAPHSEL